MDAGPAGNPRGEGFDVPQRALRGGVAEGGQPLAGRALRLGVVGRLALEQVEGGLQPADLVVEALALAVDAPLSRRVRTADILRSGEES